MDYNILKKCLNKKKIYKSDSEYRIILYRLNNLINKDIIYLNKFKEIYHIDNRINSLCDVLLDNNKYKINYIFGL
jgi:cytidylate kinase